MRAGATTRSRTLARRAVATLVLGVAVSLAFGAPSAFAGPGVAITLGSTSGQVVIGGAQIAAAADTGPTSYTIRDRPGGPETTKTLRGLTIAGLLRLVNIDPATIDYVSVVRADGSLLVLRSADITNPPFPEGPALVTNEGGLTRFLRPVRSADGTSDDVESAPGTPLEMNISGGTLLPVKASASPTRVKVGQSVTFTAKVPYPPPGANLVYIWDFGDGTRGLGARVTHQYQTSGDLQAQIKVQGSGGSTAQCASVCGGVAAVSVTVTGRARGSSTPQGLPNGGGSSTNVGGTGTGGTGTGSGSGDGGSSTQGSQPAAPAKPAKPQPVRVQRPVARDRFSTNPTSGAGKAIVQGVLLAGSGAVLPGGLPQGKAAGSPKPETGTPGTSNGGSAAGAGFVLALGLVWAGALRERRRVRLRLA
jgi:PKD domain